MSRRPSRARPLQSPPIMTPEEMRQGIARLKKRLEAAKAFDPASVTEQNNIPHVEALSAAVDEALIRTFGAETLDYKRYSDAASLTTVPLTTLFRSRSDRFRCDRSNRPRIGPATPPEANGLGSGPSSPCFFRRFDKLILRQAQDEVEKRTRGLRRVSTIACRPSPNVSRAIAEMGCTAPRTY